MLINEALRSHIQKLSQKCSKSTIIVVEGKNDVKALKPILKGFDFFILHNKQRSLYETAEVLASSYRQAILMFDADKKGMELKNTLKKYLQMHGMKVQVEQKLLKLTGKTAVEDIRVDF